MRARFIAFFQVLFLLTAVGLFAADAVKILILRDGRSLRVRSWERKGAVTNVVDERGEMMVVKSEAVDFEKSRVATEAEVRRRNATPTPTPTPKKSIVQVAREARAQREARERAAQTETPTAVGMNGDTSPPPPPTPEVVAATPAPTPAPTVAVPSPEPTAAVAVSAPLSVPKESGGGVLGYVAVVAGLLAAAGGFFVWKSRSATPVRGRRTVAARRDEEEEELLVPAFAEEPSADDLPQPVEVAKVPEELPGKVANDARALPAHVEEVQPGLLDPSGEVQIRIGADVYTCPDVVTLKGWVEEGRVIENSEVLAADGTWLMAGSIPDLEAAFAKRRETLGY